MTTKNTRKNSKADAAELANLRALAEYQATSGAEVVVEERPVVVGKSLADLVVALPEIVIKLNDADLDGLITEDLEIVLGDAEAAHAEKAEGFALLNNAKNLMDERFDLETKLQDFKAEKHAAQDEYDRTHRALIQALFNAQNGKLSWATDTLKDHPAHENVRKAIFNRADELMKVKFAKVVGDLETAKAICAELEGRSNDLKMSADDAGARGRAMIESANETLRLAGFEVKEFKSRK